MRQGKNARKNNKHRRIPRNSWVWVILGVVALMNILGMPRSSIADQEERPVVISFSIPDDLQPEKQEEIQKMKEAFKAILYVELENLESVKVYDWNDSTTDTFVDYRKEKKSHFSISVGFQGPLQDSWIVVWKIEEMYHSDDSQIKFRSLKDGYGYKSFTKEAGFKQIEAEVKKITYQIRNRIGEMTRPKVIFISCFTLIGANIVKTLQGFYMRLPSDLSCYLENALKEPGYEFTGLSPTDFSGICVENSHRSTLLNYISKADYIIDGQISQDANPDKIVIYLLMKELIHRIQN